MVLIARISLAVILLPGLGVVRLFRQLLLHLPLFLVRRLLVRWQLLVQHR